MQLLCVLLLAWARAPAPKAVTDGPMADRSRPAALEKVGVQSQVSMHHAEKADGVATGVARSAWADFIAQNGSKRRGVKASVSAKDSASNSWRADADLRERVRHATDGCVNVFVDAGANIGVHTRFLFEPAKYPHSHFTKVFKRSFGSIASNGMAPLTCSLGFEPNPRHIERHKALERAYKQMGWRYSFFPFALGVNTSEDLVFYENPRVGQGAQSEYWGFSTKQLHADQSEVRVPSASFDTVLAQIGKRRLPGHADHHPRVLVKMDIEGSEFAVVPQVMMSGSLCRVVDYISVEWHARFAPLRLHSKQRLDLGTQRGATSVKSLLQAAMADGGRAAGCLTDVFEVDDESYLHDGMPLPVSL